MKSTQLNLQRAQGLDLIKLLACLLVVSLHTIWPAKGVVNRVITLLAVTSIPLFFMTSGYLIFRRETLCWQNVLKKVLRILLVCLGWEFLHAVAHLMYYRQMRNFLESFVLDFFQQGLFYHFWYMGALILVYLAMPLLHKLFKKHPSAYMALLVALAAICAAIDLVAVMIGQQFILEVPQNLRIWTWLLYAMAGGCVAAEGKWVQRIDGWNCSKRILLVVLLLAASSGWQMLLGLNAFGTISVEAFYGAAPTLFAVLAVFLLLRKISVSERVARYITYLAGLTMGIYIMHPFILAVLNKFIPAFTQDGALMNLLFWVVTVAVSAACTAIAKKIPVLNRLLRL